MSTVYVGLDVGSTTFHQITMQPGSPMGASKTVATSR